GRGDAEVARLRRESRTSLLLRSTSFLIVTIVVASWAVVAFQRGENAATNRTENLARFMREVVPYPLRSGGDAPGALWQWTRDLLALHGLSGSVRTLALSVAAIVLAGAAALMLSLPAARNV